jgi:hypothetical protein
MGKTTRRRSEARERLRGIMECLPPSTSSVEEAHSGSESDSQVVQVVDAVDELDADSKLVAAIANVKFFARLRQTAPMEAALERVLALCRSVRAGSLEAARDIGGPSSPTGDTMARDAPPLLAGGIPSGGGYSPRSEARPSVLDLRPCAVAAIAAQAVYELAQDLLELNSESEPMCMQLMVECARMVFDTTGGRPSAVALLVRPGGAATELEPEEDAVHDETEASLPGLPRALASHSRSSSASSPTGRGRHDTESSEAGISSSTFTQLKMQLDLERVEHKKQLRDLRRSIRKVLTGIEAIDGPTAKASAEAEAPPRPTPPEDDSRLAAMLAARRQEDDARRAPPPPLKPTLAVFEQRIIKPSLTGKRGSGGKRPSVKSSPPSSTRKLRRGSSGNSLTSNKGATAATRPARTTRDGASPGYLSHSMEREMAKLRRTVQRHEQENASIRRELKRLAAADTTQNPSDLA